jgi:hypothetical protein
MAIIDCPLDEVIIQHGQRDVGQQRGEDPALRGAGDGAFPGAGVGQDTGLEERLHQRQDSFLFDPCARSINAV